MRLSNHTNVNTGMAKRQRGMSFISLIVIFSVVGLIFLLGLKIIPAYLDYFTVKKIIAAMKSSDEVRTGTVADIRKSFEKRVSADYSEVVKGEDLEITKDGNDTVVTAAWTHRIALIPRHTLLIEFSTSTADK
jgi:Domain of unknown function (DUF4845)